MTPLRWFAVFALLLAAPLAAPTDEKKDDGFVPMFNGRDLTGWVNVNCAPGTFFVKDNQIITTGKPTGYLRTAKQYENFIAEFEWMHLPPKPGAVGNSGFFVWAHPIPAIGTGYTRGIEVQVLVNLEYRDKKTGAVTASSHGDIFSIWGAKCVPDRPHPAGWERCLPSENRAKGANEWNHYRVEANDGVIKLAVNGKVVSGVSKCKPRKGYLALESEGSECRFRNLKIKELPTTNPARDEIADLDRGFKNMYTGLDLSGWKQGGETSKHWVPNGNILHYDGKGKELAAAKEFGDAEFILDFRFPNKGARPCHLVFREVEGKQLKMTLSPDGTITAKSATDKEFTVSTAILRPDLAGKWHRLHVILKNKAMVVRIKGPGNASMSLGILPGKGHFSLRPEGVMDFGNLFVREEKSQK